MSDQEWSESGFPFNPVPPNIITHVHTDVWEQKVLQLEAAGSRVQAKLLQKVVDQLRSGADSQVGPPGDSPTRVENVFLDPEVDVPRIGDALASEVSRGHMAGLFPVGTVKRGKVN